MEQGLRFLHDLLSNDNSLWVFPSALLLQSDLFLVFFNTFEVLFLQALDFKGWQSLDSYLHPGAPVAEVARLERLATVSLMLRYAHKEQSEGSS